MTVVELLELMMQGRAEDHMWLVWHTSATQGFIVIVIMIIMIIIIITIIIIIIVIVIITINEDSSSSLRASGRASKVPVPTG